MEKFGVDGIFTPDKPIFSAKGAVVTNIAHIPAALTAVMRENATRPDFAPEGSLALKPWFGSNEGLELPAALDLPVVEAMPPYNEQIAALATADRRRVPAPDDEGLLGRLADGPEDPGHQPARRLDARRRAISARIQRLPGAACTNPAARTIGSSINVAVAANVNLHGRPELAAAAGGARGGQRAQQLCLPPRRASSARAARSGAREAARRADRRFRTRPGCQERARRRLRRGFDRHQRRPRANCSYAGSARRQGGGDACRASKARGAKSVFVRYLREPPRPPDRGRGAGGDHRYPGLGAADAQAHLAADGREPAVVDAPVRHADRRVGRTPIDMSRIASAASLPRTSSGKRSLTELAYVALLGKTPSRPTCSPSRPWWGCC